MYVIIAIIMFGALIAAHELGHFFAAKMSGVKVVEFAIGMGPKLLKKQGKETLYSLRALPFGGFCAMEAEDEATEDPRGFTNARPWKRVIILVAGSAMNFAVGLLLIMLVFSQGGKFMTSELSGFMDDCPYVGEDGFLEGDEIYKIDGERIYFSSNVTTFLTRSGSDSHDIVVIRDGEKIELEDYMLVPVEYTLEDGTTAMKYGFFFASTEMTFLSYFQYSWFTAMDFLRTVRMSLVDLFSGIYGLKDLSGPVGIVSMVNDVGQSSETSLDAFYNICYFAAFISINLAFMNLLPIPAVDGGRILFLLISQAIEHISHRKLNPKYEGYIHGATFVLLIGLMVVVMFNDVVRIIG